MKAYQCDRCGKFFAHSCRNADKVFVMTRLPSNGCVHIQNLSDLCSNCQRELEEWWIKGKDKEAESEDGQ